MKIARVATIAGWAIAVLVALLSVAHLSIVRDRLLAFALDRLRTEFGVDVSVERFSYNLLTLDMDIRGMKAAALAAPDQPFVTADDLRVNLSWGALAGRVRIDDLTASSLKFSLVRREDGTLNLPPPGDGGTLDRVDIGRLTVREASAAYRDAARDLTAKADGITIALEPRSEGGVAGRLATASGPSIVTSRGTIEGTLDGLLAYDGTSLSVTRLVYLSPLGQLAIDGRLDALWSGPTSSLTVSGSLALPQVFSALSQDPPARGTVAFYGTVQGPLAAPLASISLDGESVAWRHLDFSRLHIRGSLTPDAALVDQASIELGTGTVSLRGRVEFGTGRMDAQVEWEKLSAQSLVGPVVPISIWSRLSGRADLGWNAAEGWQGLEGNAAVRSQAVGGGPEVASISGQASLALARGEWRLRHDHLLGSSVRVAGDLTGRFEGEGFGDSTVRGAFSVSSSDVSAAVPLLRTFGVAPGDWAEPRAGRLDARFRVGGSLGLPTLVGTASLNDLRLARFGPIQIDSSLTIGRRRITVEEVRASLGTNRATAAGTLDVANLALKGEANFELLELPLLAESAAPGLGPAGSLTGHLDLAGTGSSPIVRGAIAGANLVVSDRPIGDLSAEIAYADGTFTAAEVEIRQGSGGRLTAAGRYTPSTGDYSLTARADAMAIRHLGATESQSLVGILDGQFEGHGTTDRPAGAGRISLSSLAWNDAALGRAEAEVTISDDGVKVEARLPSLSTSIGADLQLGAPYPFTLEATAQETDLAPVFSALGRANGQPVQLEGRLSARLSAAGTLADLTGARAEADLQQLDLRLGDARLRLVQLTSFQYDGTRFAVRGLRLQAGATSLAASGELGRTSPAGSLDLSLQGDLEDLRLWLAIAGLPAGLVVNGAVTASLSARGALERPDVGGRLRVQDATVSWPGYPAASAGIVDARLEGDVIYIEQVGTRWEGATASARMEIPLGFLAEWLPSAIAAGSSKTQASASLVGRIDAVSQAALVALAGEDLGRAVTGQASLQLNLRADAPSLQSVYGTISVDDLRANVEGMSLTQVHPTRVDIASGALQVVAWTWELSGNRIDVAGRVGVTDEGGNVDLRVGGQMDLRMLAAFLPGTTGAGLADVSLVLSGSVAAPLADGAVQIRNGELRLADPQLALSELQGRVVLDGDQLHVLDMRGALNGGRFTVTGSVQHRQLGLTAGSLVFQGFGTTLDMPQGVRTVVDSDLLLSLADRPRLTGRVTVQRGAYREPLSLAAGILSAARQRAVQVSGGVSSPTFLDRLELDVVVASSQDLIVDNNYGRMDIGLDVRLVGTARRPSLVGRAAIREGGVLYLGGRTYQVERGSIDFTNPRAIVPNLDLSARTYISGYDVSLAITGTPETVKGTLSSTPSLSQTDIASLLVTGRRSDQIGGAGTQVAGEQVLGYLSGEALGFAARAVGLDTLRLERGVGVEELQSDPSLIAGDVDPAARLTLSKQFSRFVEVTLSQNLRESGLLTWIASFSPYRTVELRTISRDDRSRSYELRHDLSFGGVAPEPGAGGVGRDREERVMDVRFTGDLGLSPAVLREALDLKVGDRFDFYRWQDDRSRLRQLYLDRGYLEAQIGAVRAAPPPASAEVGVALEYEVDRGPLARLDITGLELPRSVVGDLNGIWSNAVFDEALVADLTLAVRRYLAERGYLRAVVAVSRQPADPGEKRIRIEIEPGARTATREIQFFGNAAVPTSRLETLASEGVGLDAWLAPAALARGVEALYHDEGLLAARVTAGPIEFSDRRAVLPVRVDEGSPFLVSEVVVSNIAARTEDDVRRVLPLRAGDRYSVRAIEQARSVVEADYARRGFITATSAIDTVVDRAKATARILVRIEEGPQQVLDTVTIEGATDLRPQTILDTLNLQTGAPVNMDTWYDARRRLLNTGLFERVDLEAVPLEAAAARGIQSVEARVGLRRWPIWRLRYGLEVTDETAPASEGRELGAGVSADLQRRTLFGRAGTVGTSLRASADKRVGRGFVTLPSFFGQPVVSSLFVSRSRETISESGFLPITTDKTTFTAEQRLRPRGDLQVAYGYHFERNHTVFADRDPGDPDSTFETQQARLTATVLLDTRNDPFDPGRGVLHSSALEYAPAALGADARFIKYFLQQFVYRPLAPQVIAASGVRLGVGRGFGQRLIPSERFFAGGINTVRGYPDNLLGGVDFFGDPVGGQATLVLNQEIRFPIYRWVRGVGFLDAGNVFSEAHDISLSALDVGVGAGLRFSTPLGLFRLDLAIPLPKSDRPPRWHFTFGQMF